MVDPVTPTRDTLYKMAAGDNRLMIALERLFQMAGTETPADIERIDRAIEFIRILLDEVQKEAGVKTNIPANLPLDSIEFDRNAAWSHAVPGTVGWNRVDDTLDVVNSGGVVLQVGQETHAIVENSTGSLIPNGSVVGVAGVGINERVQVSPYIANGTRTSLNIAGVTTQDIPDTGSRGRITVWGIVRDLNTTGVPVGETWAVGQVLYPSTTIAGAFTNVKPTAPNVVVPIAIVLKVNATTGAIFVRPVIEQQKYYGGFLKTDNGTLGAINTATSIVLTSTSFANGVSLGTPASRIVFANAGLYSIAATFQFQSTNTSAKDVYFWYRKNGVDVPDSTYIITNNLGNGYFTASRSRSFSMVAGDYLELFWACTSTNITLIANAATAFCPASPSVNVQVFQIQQ